MALLHTRRSLVKDLQVGIQLLLSEDPGRDQMVEQVRLFDPDARPASAGRICVNSMRQIYLTSPTAIDAGMAVEAQVPPGMTTAYFTQFVARGAPTSASAALKDLREAGTLLVNGLAVRLGGIARPHPTVLRGPMQVTVFTPRPVPQQEVGRIVAGQLADVTPIEPNDWSRSVDVAWWRAAAGQLEIECWPPRSSGLAATRPAALGHTRWEPNTWTVTLFRTAQEAARTDPALTSAVGRAALAVASATNGLCIDQFGFRVLRPEDLIIRLLASTFTGCCPRCARRCARRRPPRLWHRCRWRTRHVRSHRRSRPLRRAGGYRHPTPR
jgi:hypothetical protein